MRRAHARALAVPFLRRVLLLAHGGALNWIDEAKSTLLRDFRRRPH